MINRTPIIIAVIAHDSKKLALVDFVKENLTFFLSNDIEIISTDSTGRLIEEVGIKVVRFNSGPLGGDAQIASRVVEGCCDLVIFFRDPLDKHPHECDIAMLSRVCDVHNVPIATNSSSARLLIGGLHAYNEMLLEESHEISL